MANVSIGAYLAVVLIFLFLACCTIVYVYAEPGFPWHSYITLTLGYYAAFGILLLVPLDIAVVVYDRRQTDSGTYTYDIDTLGVFYDTFFTMVLILGSVVLIFEEYYNTDGYFTLGSRLSSSFKRMCMDNAAPLVVGLIVLGILMGQHVVSNNADALKLTAVIVTNTCYEFGLMFLLGYALVEFPRSMWLRSDLDKYLLSTQQRAAAQFKAISEAQLSVSLVVSDVLKTKAALSSYADPLLAQAMDTLVSECPPEFRSDRLGKVASNKQGQITIDTLASLRTRLNNLKDAYRMSQAKVEGTKLLAYTLEDICAAKNNAEASVIRWSLLGKDSSTWDYNWEISYKPLLRKLGAIFFLVLSILSFLGVICSMSGVDSSVSVYYLAVHSDSVRPAGIVLFILLTLGYTVYITTWAIFQMKFGANMELVPNRTTPEALSFNVRMIARLAAPLAFFYLGKPPYPPLPAPLISTTGWISENGLRTGSFTKNDAPTIYNDTSILLFNVTSNSTYWSNSSVVLSDAEDMPSAFSNFYQLQNIHTVQQVFGTIFPIVLFVVLGLFVLNIFNRLLVLVKLDAYQFGAEIVTEEVLREGKRQLDRHKKNTERAYRRGELRSFLQRVTGPASTPDFKEAEGGGGWLGCFKKKPKDARDMLNMAGETPSMREPATLKGNCQRKGGFKLGGGAWKDAYAEVRHPGFLYVFKDAQTATATPSQHTLTGHLGNNKKDSDLTILDLRLVLDFKIVEKKHDANEINIETVDASVQLRFASPEDLECWRQGLIDWKDFCVDYGTLFAGTGAKGDIESNTRSSGSGVGSAPAQSPMAPMDLDNIHVDEGSDDEGEGKAVRPLMKGFISSSATTAKRGLGMFGLGGGKKPAESTHAALTVHDGKPKALEGWLEKKSHAMVGESWAKRYCRIDEASTALLYCKSSDTGASAAGGGSINLQLVKDVTVYEKNGKQDFSRFNVDLGEKVFKFRAANEPDGKRWVDGLNEWRDYFLLNM